jgi:hypothetical protein
MATMSMEQANEGPTKFCVLRRVYVDLVLKMFAKLCHDDPHCATVIETLQRGMSMWERYASYH